MNRKTFAGVSVLLILVSIISWKLGEAHGTARETSGNSPSPGRARLPLITSSETEVSFRQTGVTGKSTSGGRSPVSFLESLAEKSPGLIGSMGLCNVLIDGSNDPNVSAWEAIGLDQKAGEKVSAKIKASLKELWKAEAANTQTLEKSDTLTKILIPRMEPAAAQKYIASLEASFSGYFGAELSRQMTQGFIRRSPVTAALNGQHRVISITLTPEDEQASTKRSYQVRAQILAEGNTTLTPEMLQDLDRYSSYDSKNTFEETPDYLSEFIGSTGK